MFVKKIQHFYEKVLTQIHVCDIITIVNLIQQKKGGNHLINSEILCQKISDSGMTITYIANKIGISREGLYNKLNNETEFKASEIAALKKLLRLSVKERDTIFFAN